MVAELFYLEMVMFSRLLPSLFNIEIALAKIANDFLLLFLPSCLILRTAIQPATRYYLIHGHVTVLPAQNISFETMANINVFNI